MVEATSPLASRKSTNRIFVIFCISIILSLGIVTASASPAQKKTYSSGTLRSMARVYMASGGYEKARPFLEKALHLAKETNASDSEVSACMLDLAFLYKSQGRLAEAVDCWERWLSVHDPVASGDENQSDVRGAVEAAQQLAIFLQETHG